MQLSVKQIRKQYASILAVDNLSFTVKSGEIFALLGPNGAGKSSTIRMLIGLTHADSGCIEFTDHFGQTKSTLQSGDFGYLPEERGLYQESTIQQTLVYIARLKGMKKVDAAQQVEEWLNRFDLADRKHDPLKSLSKGNQQKVQLISAIIHRPSIAFLDEPFSGLDPVNQEKVIEFLFTLKAQGTTIILSVHQMSLVEKLADRFLLMNRGKATFYGSMKQIRAEAELGSSLTITFMNNITDKDFSTSEDITGIEELRKKVIKFTLSTNCHMPSLLQNMMSEHQIESLQTEQPSLHDIYLNSVKELPNE
jgi:ABC-2 type transport system ATP-binding protein